MNDIEKQLRIKLAASHHVVYYNGWSDLLATHLSVKIPDTNHVLITPHNVPFEQVSASKLVKVDLDDNVIGDNGFEVMPQAVNIHTSVYRKKQSIFSVMHTHSLYGTAVSSLDCGLLFCNQHALRFYNDVAYHEFDGLALENEGELIAASLGDKQVMILSNHGLITTGDSIEQTLYRLYYLEKVCEMQIVTLSAGQTLKAIPKVVCEKTKAQFDSILTPDNEFDVLVDRIEELSSVDYRS